MLDNLSDNYCIYLRKSRKDLEAEQHGEGDTLKRHKEILIALAKRHKLNIIKIYEEVVSGESIAARPEIQNLLMNIELCLYKGVIVMEVERLARGDTIDQGIISRTFQLTGTKIVTPNKIYDPANEFDQEYFEFGLFMSRREYKTITRRINQGRLASVKEGNYISSVAPYGYERIKLEHEKGYTLSPVSPQSDAVRLIFNLYINGFDGEEYGTYKIARYLDSLGIKPMVNKTWTVSSIRDILKNEVYTGKIIWGKRKEVKSVEQGLIKKTRPAAQEYICVSGKHKAIIDENTFLKAQKILKSHGKNQVNANKLLRNPLSGFIYCAKCGTLMTRLGENSKNRYAALKCPNRYCDNISAPLYLVEKKIVSFLKIWLKGKLIELDYKDCVSCDTQVNLIEAGLKSLSEEGYSLNKQLLNAYDFLEKEIYTKEIFLERNHYLIKEIEQNTVKINDLTKKYNEITRRKEQNNPSLKKAVLLMDSYDYTDDTAKKNRLLKELVEKVTYLKTERNTKNNVNNCNFTLEIYPKLCDNSAMHS